MSIKLFENFLDLNFIKYLKDKLYNNINEPVWSSNIGWEIHMKKSSAEILTYRLNQDKYIYDYIKNKYDTIFPELKDKEIKISYFIYSRLSYLPFHNDTSHFFASTIYLNETWDEDNGGLFLYKENNEIKAIVPKFNLALTNNNNIVHGTSLTTMGAPYRESLQIFFDNKKND